jgi:hypothetical protein
MYYFSSLQGFLEFLFADERKLKKILFVNFRTINMKMLLIYENLLKDK